MSHYLLNFSVYTIAMIGFILLSLFVFKACTGDGLSRKSSIIKIIDTMRLSARKTLYVIEAEGEKYLIASDVDSTSLIAKLGNGENDAPLKNYVQQKLQPVREDRMPLKNFESLAGIKPFTTVDFKTRISQKQKEPMMKKLLEKLDK